MLRAVFSGHHDLRRDQPVKAAGCTSEQLETD
jgi:hypothetical protein